MFVLDRRHFFSLFAWAFPARSVFAQPTTFIYASESFVHRRPGPFVLGFLITTAPERHIRAIRDIKDRTRYSDRLMAYSSTDALRISCARSMLQYFIEQPDLRFVGRTREGDYLSDQSRSGQYPSLFEAARIPRGAILRLKARVPGKRYNFRRGDGEAEVASRIKSLESRARGQAIQRGNNDGLVELSTLLTGALFGSHSQRGRIEKLHPTKTLIVSRLRSLLRVNNLSQRVPGKWELR